MKVTFLATAFSIIRYMRYDKVRLAPSTPGWLLERLLEVPGLCQSSSLLAASRPLCLQLAQHLLRK